MFKKLLFASLLCTLSFSSVAFAEPTQKDMISAQNYFEEGETYTKQSQYSSAIEAYKKGLRLNPYSNSLRIGIINAYNLRATYYANKTREYNKAMNDIRSALFYLKYFGYEFNDEQGKQAIAKNENILIALYKQTQIASELQNRYQIAKNLRKEGEFAASAYEFIQTLSVNDLKEDSSVQIGDLYTILGNPLQAVDYYKEALKIDNTKPTTHLKLAKAYDSLGEAKLANNEYNYTLVHSGNNQLLMLELESIWIKKLGINPNDADAHNNLGAVYQKMGDYPKALQEYSKAKILNPQNVTTRFNMATLYQNQKEYNLAIGLYDDVLQINPEDTQARYYKALCLMETKQFRQASVEAEKILEIDPNNTEARDLMLSAMKNSSTPEELRESLAETVENNPNDAETTYTYAIELHKSNNLDLAIEQYEKTLTLDPNNNECYLNLAQAYKESGNIEKAKETLQKGIDLFPDYQHLSEFNKSLQEEVNYEYESGALNSYNEGNYETALKSYLSINPKDANTYINIASCYTSLKNYKKALDAYKQAYIKAPNNIDIALYMAQTYIKMEDWNNAKIYLSKVISTQPNNKNAKELYSYVIDQNIAKVLNNAMDFYNKKDYVNALAIINTAINQNKNNAYAYYYRGLVNDAQKNYSIALNDYIKALSIQNNLIEAYYSIAVDYEYLKNYRNAYAYYKKYLTMATEENEYTNYAKQRLDALQEYSN